MRYIYLIMIVFLLFGCADRYYEVKDTRDIMGTFVTITVHDQDEELANRAMELAYQEIYRIDSLLSNYKNDSEVSRLNRDKVLKHYSEDIYYNLEKSIFYAKLSNGSFDITVQPVLDLYTDSFTNKGRPPNATEVEDALSKVDYTQVELGDTVRIGNNQKITLGGIAKGYAVDQAIEVLRGAGISNALVNAGGDMKAIGHKYGRYPWHIALANPRDKNDYIEQIDLLDKSIVTSGDYERYFDENKSFHHIVNPKTGYSATDLMSVTVVSDRAMDADAISTSVFVLGEDGINLIESLDNVEGLLITRDKRIIKSSGFS